jgi:hypothetical protein
MEIEYDLQPECIGRHEVVAYLESKLAQLRQMVIARPGPGVPLTNREALHWQRKFMAYYGKVLGNIEGLVAVGMLPVDKAKQMEYDLKRFIQYHMGVLYIGGK